MLQQLQEKWGWVEGTHTMRTSLMDTLTDAELVFNPGGQNMTLGQLCLEMGEIEHAYLESFKNFTQNFAYRNPEEGLDGSVGRLKAWYEKLDSDMQATLAAMSETDAQKLIDRGGFEVPVAIQMDIYLQALLIFFGKATVYLKAMNKPLPQQIQEWIG